MNHQSALTAYIAAFVAELVHAGIKDVVVSPGSRSTPMAMVMAEHPGLNLHIHVDERSAAFFALGIAKATGKPAAILCTSGTAAANYFPAIVEARYSRVPLLVLTADRPHELRDVGAPQAIDQIDLYGKHVKWFNEMALPEEAADMIRYVRTVCARAASVAIQAPAGPVHLNFPFREPLIPDLENDRLFELPERAEGYVSVQVGSRTLAKEDFERIAAVLEKHEKGIIVCGQLGNKEFAGKVEQLAEALGYPVLADPLSQLRSATNPGDWIVDAYDAFLRFEEAKSILKPEVVIRFGAMPVSKALGIFLKENRNALQFVVDGGGGWLDPHALSTEMVYCDEALFCEGLLQHIQGRQGSGFSDRWLKMNGLAKAAMEAEMNRDELNESFVFRQLSELLPEGASLFVGNSMPIRDLDSFFWKTNKRIKVMANRGANGIDGVTSSALGASLYAAPMYLVLGDLTFFHDMNGLIAAKQYGLDLTVILINNNGGGIFSFLPQSGQAKNFERLFGTPLGLDYSHVVEMYGGKFSRVENWLQFNESIELAKEEPGLKVIEVVTDREANAADHRRLWKAVSREINKFMDMEK
ncbi:2-succinyl-5-enolpyruvyl-6-hydroxy-3-cyclohexene-1-carboxylic-acid synthase [Neobacillus notoginsengisoli]|uniref:2-succinyl-5-enolpyruvyl-6-hydroxy-3-cyclohexene-1-carboxylate synthase n=1 Tax=Neobacillus notoginsengisoli TaxID=1578198 RepID=A0A417YDP8_9BACI|nr:2-succinyl-5-enolpyruvyl-6-hydroxy-3-cyclohexene-1-carboxylic-acid synthase [Neobacillus notoginsengisoli]RHW30742.1 2-succinyl-5-enolpyruvyl-6-hydroxy-3-cyclohexene-1-carboxylic-acid synthase [Neobacillus notoginsengisoli]